MNIPAHEKESWIIAIADSLHDDLMFNGSPTYVAETDLIIEAVQYALANKEHLLQRFIGTHIIEEDYFEDTKSVAAEVLHAIHNVVTTFEQEQKEHFDATPPSMRAGHIYHSIQTLKRFHRHHQKG